MTRSAEEAQPRCSRLRALRERGFRPGYLGIALLWQCGIYALSSWSGPVGEPSWARVYSANATHALIFAGLAFWIAMGVPRTRRWALIAFFVTVLLGAADELHQSYVPNRTPSILDWMTDSFGALFGVAFQRIWQAEPGDRPMLCWLLGLGVFFAAASALAATVL